eukprot:8177-Amphidinium_carterae.1
MLLASGHQLVFGGSSLHRCTAICLSPELSKNSSSPVYGEHSVMIHCSKGDLRTTFISVYLPHSGHSQETWESALFELDSFLTSAHRRVVMAGDLQEELCTDGQSVSTHLRLGSHPTWRGAQLQELLQKHNLVATNTWMEESGHDKPTYTWEAWSGTSRKQIDFICARAMGTFSWDAERADFTTDHLRISPHSETHVSLLLGGVHYKLNLHYSLGSRERTR